MRLPELIPLLCQAWLLGSRAALIERRGRVIVGLAQHIAACRAMSLSQGSASGDAADVRFGSKADDPERANFVRFTPESGHRRKTLFRESPNQLSPAAAVD